MLNTRLDVGSVREQLEYDEGVVYEIYNDHLGYATFGVGHLVTREDPEYGDPVGTPVREYRVMAAFDSDLRRTLDDCKRLYGEETWFALPGEVKEILTNMCFNLGMTRLSKFKKMNKAVKEHDWLEAAKEGRDSKWYRQVTKRAERLMIRMENV